MLDLVFWEGHVVDSSQERAEGSLSLSLSEDPSYRPRCGRCGSDCVLIHERRQRRVRDRDWFDRRVWLDVPIRRLDCYQSGTRAGERITHRLRAWVEALVQILPIAHVAELTGLHWHTIKRIDQFALHKGHRYATVTMDAECIRVLWGGEGNSHEAIPPFFELLDKEG